MTIDSKRCDECVRAGRHEALYASPALFRLHTTNVKLWPNSEPPLIKAECTHCGSTVTIERDRY